MMNGTQAQKEVDEGSTSKMVDPLMVRHGSRVDP